MHLTPKQKNIVYVAGFSLIVFAVTYTILLILGLVPKQFEAVQVDTKESIFQVVGLENNIKKDVVLETNAIPQKISIPKIGVSSTIQIPQSVDVATLDSALSKGAVYYPGSGNLASGNMFLFGHSTNWKIVNNQAYKTFNDLDKLKFGDQIELTSDNKKYIYSVTKVWKASEDDVLVEFNKGERMLTISTCDTFGQKQDRWIVEAEFLKVI